MHAPTQARRVAQVALGARRMVLGCVLLYWALGTRRMALGCVGRRGWLCGVLCGESLALVLTVRG